MLQNEALVAKIGFDTPENEPSKVCRYQHTTSPRVISSAPQERLAHALRERVDGARHRLQVGAQVTGRRDVLLVLLLPDRRRLLEVSLGLCFL